MTRSLDGRRWVIRAVLVGLAAAGIGSGCRTWHNGAEMTEPRPIFHGDEGTGTRGGALGPKSDPLGSNQAF